MQLCCTHRIAVSRIMVFDCSESSEPILEDEDAERITGRHENVESEIELEAVNKKRL